MNTKPLWTFERVEPGIMAVCVEVYLISPKLPQPFPVNPSTSYRNCFALRDDQWSPMACEFAITKITADMHRAGIEL